MPLWVDDYLNGSVAAFTYEEQGVYMRLLLHQWKTGMIPAEPYRIARILGITLKDLDRVWPTLEHKFPGGQNPRCEAVYAEALAKHLSHVARGKLGGRPRKS